RDADARRRAIGGAGDVHEPGFRLQDRGVSGKLTTRTGLAIAGHGRENQPGTYRRQRSEAEPQAIERPRPEVFYEHVGFPREPSKDIGTVRRLQVQREAALVAVHSEEIAALTAGHERCKAARVVARTRFLDLDDVGAHVAEQHGAERPG